MKGKGTRGELEEMCLMLGEAHGNDSIHSTWCTPDVQETRNTPLFQPPTLVSASCGDSGLILP